jgi:Host cell surface-exposed lipoprotein
VRRARVRGQPPRRRRLEGRDRLSSAVRFPAEKRSAENYLDFSAFSRKGLIEQLSSEYGEGFSKADAIYAVNHLDVDWNEQAAKSAKNYLDQSAFSRQGLIEQLSSEYGEGFSRAQAVYGVNQTGL